VTASATPLGRRSERLRAASICARSGRTPGALAHEAWASASPERSESPGRRLPRPVRVRREFGASRDAAHQRSSGSSAGVACRPLLRFVQGSSERRVETRGGDCRFRRRAAVSPCAPARRPTRKPRRGPSTRSLPWESGIEALVGRACLRAPAGPGAPRSCDRDRTLAESCARGERRCRFAALGVHAVLQCALVVGLRAGERWTRGEAAGRVPLRFAQHHHLAQRAEVTLATGVVPSPGRCRLRGSRKHSGPGRLSDPTALASPWRSRHRSGPWPRRPGRRRA
jgi:hypothetical protein